MSEVLLRDKALQYNHLPQVPTPVPDSPHQKERNVDCTPSEFRLLKELVTHADQVLTRKQLIERLWDVDEAFEDDNTLSVYIKRLRDKLEEDAVYIQTVRGIGYTFSLGNSTKSKYIL